MSRNDLENIPFMLYANSNGQVYDHPYYRMVGFSGMSPMIPGQEDLLLMPEFSKLFYIPDCPPVGLDPSTGEYNVVPEVEINGNSVKCYAVASFREPGLVRTLLPAVDY